MKAIRFYKYFVPAALCVLIAVLSLPLPFSAGAHNYHYSASSFIQPQSDPNANLSRGRALLKQGHADQALGYLETALSLFTQSNSSRGVAAAQDALGDLYLVQGQYKVALDHYRSAYEAFASASSKDQNDQAVASSVASRAGSTAAAATETAGSAAANGFNANLMLAKIGDTNYRLGRLSEASTSYAMMTVKKPESAGAKVTRHLGGLGGIIGGIQSGRVSIGAPTDAAVGLLETKKEIDEYRVTIVYMTYELGMGRIAFANNDLDTARKHFQNALESGSGALPPQNSSTMPEVRPRKMVGLI